MKPSINRQVGLDLARTLAILGVVLVHTRVYSGGRFGVQLFFMLSGYLLLKMDTDQNAREFIIRRALRLFPLYWFFFILYFFTTARPNSEFLLFQLLLIQNIVWWIPAISGVWSISNEWFYSLTLITIQRIGRRGIIALIFATWAIQVIASGFVFRNDIVAEDAELGIWLNTLNPFINFVFFLIGVGIKRRFVPVFNNLIVAVFLLSVLVGFGVLIGRDLIFLWTVGVYLIFSICLKANITSKILVRFISHIGQRTYSIFFVHFIVLELVYKTPFFITTYEDGGLLMKIFAFFVILVISVLLSEITWQLIEKPSIRLSKKRKRAASGI